MSDKEFTRALSLIMDELYKAEEKFPGFPRDIIHCSAVLAEECGEVVKASLDYHYGRVEEPGKLIEELAQTGAMCLRFLFRMFDSKYYPEQEER